MIEVTISSPQLEMLATKLEIPGRSDDGAAQQVAPLRVAVRAIARPTPAHRPGHAPGRG